MADDLSTAQKWDEKGAFLRRALNDHVKDVREKRERARQKKKNQQIYRGPEHDWYGAWNYTWAKICGDTCTLLPTPQPRLTRFVSDEDENKVKRELIPDFGILHVATNRPRAGLNRSCHQIGPGGRKKWVGLMEIKPPQGIGSSTEDALGGVLEARHDLVLQVKHLFAGDKSRASKKAVIGISAAGSWWAWELFTSDSIKPLSKHKDGTFRPSEEPEDNDDEPLLDFHELGSEGSDEAMAEMLEAIRELPGSRIFGNVL